MATLLRVPYHLTGQADLYLTVQQLETEYFWNGSSLETLTVANFGNYDLPLTESPAGSYSYTCNFPAGITDACSFRLTGRVRLGASPAPSDPRFWEEIREWDGTSLVDVPPGLTVSVQAAIAAAGLEAGVLTIRRGDTWQPPVLSVLGSLAGRDRLWLTVKESEQDEDGDSTFQMTEDEGLLVLLGAEAETPADGSLEVMDEDAATVQPLLAAAVTALLTPGRYRYDMQASFPGGVVTTVAEGHAFVTADVTHATE